MGNEILIGIASSLLTAGVLTFALKTFIGKLIETEFKKRMDANQANLELLKDHQHWLQETQRAIYPELNALVYQTRNAVRDFIERDDPRYGQPIREYAKTLTERLYSYRAFLPPPVFKELHEFKHRVQDLVLAFDVQTRGGMSKSGDSPWHVVPSDAKEIYQEIDRLYNSITRSVQEIVLKGRLPGQEELVR